MAILAETEAPVMVMVSESGLIMIEKFEESEKHKLRLPARDMKYVQPHLAFLLLAMNFL